MDPLTILLLLGGGALVMTRSGASSPGAGARQVSTPVSSVTFRKSVAGSPFGAAPVGVKGAAKPPTKGAGIAPPTPAGGGGRTAASVAVDVATVGACAAGIYTGGATLAACAPAAGIVYGYGKDLYSEVGSWF